MPHGRSIALFALFLGLQGCGAASAEVARPPLVTSVAGQESGLGRAELPVHRSRPAAGVLGGARMTILCESRPCAASVGLWTRRGPAEPVRCTATLVAGDRVLTAGHCLAPRSRRKGARCRDATVTFPAAAGEAPEIRRCEEVIAATSFDDASALHPDYALLRLSAPIERPVVTVDSTPMRPGDVVSVVSLTPDRERPEVHRLRARRCRVDDAIPAVRVLGEAARAVGWLDLCPIRPGNSGAAVFDADGRVRGIVHGGSPPLFARAVVTVAEDLPLSSPSGVR